jgi:hypothetical protein
MDGGGLLWAFFVPGIFGGERTPSVDESAIAGGGVVADRR